MLYYVSNTGNDANDGSQPTQGSGTVGPLATMQSAVDRMTPGTHTIQLVADLPAGQEASFAPVNIAHDLFVAIVGVNDPSMNWARTKIVATGSNVGIWAQDHATVTAQYVAFEGRAIATRQYAIADAAFCTFRGTSSGPIIYSGESSRFNAIGELRIKGGGSNFVLADDFSTISLNTALKYDGASTVSFSDANIKAIDSHIKMSGASITNLFPAGKQWSLVNSLLEKGSVIVPGSINGTADGYSIFR